MKFAYSDINGYFDWEQPVIPTIIIENQSLFRKLLKDISSSINGIETNAVLSKNNSIIEFSKHAEILNDFINFNINKKTLLNKICLSLEKMAVSPENYIETQKLLAEIENKIGIWSFDFSCNIIPTKVSVSSIIKSVGIEICDDYSNEVEEVEKIIDYMELIREFECEKVFFTVNMRSFYNDEIIKNFIDTAISHEFKVLMIESYPHTLLKNEKRLTIDTDLCEF